MKKQIKRITIKIEAKEFDSSVELNLGNDDHKIAEAVMFLSEQNKLARDYALDEENAELL